MIRSRADLGAVLRRSRQTLTAIVRETSGADSEPVRQSAAVLVKNWRRLLSVRGDRAEPSAPNEPPRQRTRFLRRSIRTAVVDGVRRVGSGDFRARLFEFGGYKDRSGQPEPPRPHGRVALEQSADQMTEVMATEGANVLRQGGR